MYPKQHRNRKTSSTKWSNRKIVLFGLAMSLFTVNASASDLDVFLDKCGSCHKKGGEAAPVNPADKAGLVWSKYFQRNRHPIDLSTTINANEQEQILSFLKHHAADSDHPVAAIIPK